MKSVKIWIFEINRKMDRKVFHFFIFDMSLNEIDYQFLNQEIQVEIKHFQ